MTAHSTSTLWIACLCADWCGTCQTYRVDFEALQNQNPEGRFVWVDIESKAPWLGDLDVENFPTLLLFRTANEAPHETPQLLFWGTVLPHISHLSRLLKNFESDDAAIEIKQPSADVLALCQHIVQNHL